MILLNFLGQSWTKMSEICINAMKNIDEVEQTSMLANHLYYKIT